MASRLIVILIGIPLVYFVLAAGDLPRMAFFSAISIRGQYEFFAMLGSSDWKHPILEYAAGVLILMMCHFMKESGILFGTAIALIFLASAAVLRGLNGTGYKRFALGVTSLMYLPFCLAFFQLFSHEKGHLELFGVLATIWSLDIGAYIVGCSVRGPKLAPQISPNKTISGAIGGTVSSIGFMYLLHSYGLFQVPTAKLLVFAVILSVIGQISDLFESVLKREAGVKDTGAILGKHGGMLDRIDSVVFLGPLTYLFLAK